jgi:hypothetical protein
VSAKLTDAAAAHLAAQSVLTALDLAMHRRATPA